MQILWYVFLLVIGFIALIKGADFFVEGSASVAKRLKVPGVIIGLTIVAMGTSAPELAVSVSAALSGANEIAVSNVVGSNIFNLLVVLGVCAVMRTLPVGQDIKKRDYPLSLIFTLAVFLLAGNLVLSGNCKDIHNMEAVAGTLFRWNGLVLVVFFILYLALTVYVAKKNRLDGEEDDIEILSSLKCVMYIVGGLIAIIVGGKLVVYGAEGVALELGMSETLVGLTIVAIGTSLPELVTSIVAARKGETGMAIGNVVGSNIFNLLLILGVSATIHPIGIQVISFIDLGMLLGVSLIGYAFVCTGKKINRIEGSIMIAMYAAYMVYAVIR